MAAFIRPTSNAPLVRPKRPLYLVAVLTLISILAILGWTDGCQTVRTLRNPHEMKAMVERTEDPRAVQWETALIDAMVVRRARTLPLAVAQFLLGFLLWSTTMGLLFGRGHLRVLLMQALVAYAALLSVAFVVRAPLRGVQIESLLTGDLPSVEGHSREDMAATLRVFAIWMARGVFALQLGILGSGLFVLTRPRVRAWLSPSVPIDTGRNGGDDHDGGEP